MGREGWEPAIPYPYYSRPWRRFFRLTPGCWLCSEIFNSKNEHDEHWKKIHQRYKEQ